jgi:thiol-disulfide isomerase/thioredoxin
MRSGASAIVVAVCLFACEGKPLEKVASQTAIQGVGTAAPPLVGKTLTGEPFELAALRGNVVLVNVWATWCAPCRHELPELVRLHHLHRDRGFAVVGVSVDARRAAGALRAMVQEFELDYPIVLDPDQKGVEPFGIRGYPTSILVDREGVVRWRRDGIIDVDDSELDAAISAALAGS